MKPAILRRHSSIPQTELENGWYPLGVVPDTEKRWHLYCFMTWWSYLRMDQYLLIPFLGEWPSIYQLFWCSPGVQGFDTLPFFFMLLQVDQTLHTDMMVTRGRFLLWSTWNTDEDLEPKTIHSHPIRFGASFCCTHASFYSLPNSAWTFSALGTPGISNLSKKPAGASRPTQSNHPALPKNPTQLKLQWFGRHDPAQIFQAAVLFGGGRSPQRRGCDASASTGPGATAQVADPPRVALGCSSQACPGGYGAQGRAQGQGRPCQGAGWSYQGQGKSGQGQGQGQSCQDQWQGGSCQGQGDQGGSEGQGGAETGGKNYALCSQVADWKAQSGIKGAREKTGEERDFGNICGIHTQVCLVGGLPGELVTDFGWSWAENVMAVCRGPMCIVFCFNFVLFYLDILDPYFQTMPNPDVVHFEYS